MHDDEVRTDLALVRRLLAAQFSQWVDLDIHPVRSNGTDNAMYRLGDRLAARLPRRASAVRSVDKELEWLPRLAPSLPLPISLPIAQGAPGEGYPFPWLICSWLDGENPTPGGASGERMAVDLAVFIRVLQTIDAASAPPPGHHNHGRGAPLAQWRSTIHDRLAWLADMEDIATVTTAWEADAGAKPWDGPPMWIHGDLSAGNMLVRGGRLSGVIDWSCLGAGDPACDLQVAWTLFNHEARQAFRTTMAVDEAMWIRGRAWGLALGVLNLSYYRTRNPRLAESGKRAIAAVLANHGRGPP